MDKDLDKKTIRKRGIKRSVGPLLIVLTIGATIIFGPRLFQAKIKILPSDIQVVDTGAITISTPAAGKVLPSYTEIITSPLSTEVLQLNYHPGDSIAPGDTLLHLNLEEIKEKYNRLKWELAMKKNTTSKKREALMKEGNSLRIQLQKDSMSTQQLKAEWENQKALLAMGGTSKEAVRKAALAYEMALLEGRDRRQKYSSFSRQVKLDLENLKLEIKLQEQTLKATANLLKKAILSPHLAGTLVQLKAEPGQHVSAGQELARIASIGSYKIEGKLSSQQSDKIYPGQQAIVEIRNKKFKAYVNTISPGLEQGAIKFTLMLEEPKHRVLKSNLKVDIFLINENIENSLRIPNGTFYKEESTVTVYVVEGGELIKREVELGGASYDYVEIKSGLKAGEKLVTELEVLKKAKERERVPYKIKNI